MGVSHIALAVKDIEKTHRFHAESMGFDLVKAEIVSQKGGFARHVFCATGRATNSNAHAAPPARSRRWQASPAA